MQQLYKTLRVASAVSALLLASAQAFAQLPSPTPQSNFDDPVGNPNGGDLLVAVWDDVAGVSLVQNLGFNFNQFTESLVTPDSGGQINFGTLQGFDAFAGSLAGNINYMVFGILNIGTGSGQRQLLITKTAAGGTYNNGTVNQGVGAIGSFTNTDMRLPTGCDGAGNVSPCEANNVNDVGYAGNLGGGQLGSRLGGNLAPANAASGLIGTALNFFQVSSAGTSTIGNATSTQYANSTGFASWLLNGAGVLTYTVPGEVSVVPLPAAAWLLLSALAGFGAVTRRRQA